MVFKFPTKLVINLSSLVFFVLFFLFSLFLKVNYAFAASYYVDATGGNDSNSGISSDLPWKTISKINSTTFSSGDNVLFKRGETWTGTQVTAQSGIRYADYGTGNKPIIDCNNAISYAFLSDSLSNVAIENLDLRNCTSSGASFKTTNGITVTNCDMSGAGNDNLLIWNSSSNATITGGKFFNAAAGGGHTGIEIADGGNNFTVDGIESYSNPIGISIHNHPTTDVPDNVTIQNCSTHNNTTNGIQIGQDGSTGTKTITVKNCVTYTNATNGVAVNSISGTNYISGNITIQDVTAYGNAFRNFDITGDDVTLLRPISYKNGVSTNKGVRILNSLRTKIYNMTLYLEANTGFSPLLIDGARTDNFVMKNSALIGGDSGVTPIEITATTAPTTKTWSIDYNAYVLPQPTFVRWKWNGTTYSFANWKIQSGQDSNSTAITSGSFQNLSGFDFHLQSGSSLKDAGTNLGYSYSGTLPDIGAYEFSLANAPTGLTQSISGLSGGTFTFNMTSLDNIDTLTPQIEIQPWDTPFTNSTSFSGTSVSYSGSSVTGFVTVPNFGSGKFHWQAMISNYAGNGSWTQYGSSGAGVDFEIGFPVSGSTTCNVMAPKSIPRLYLANPSNSTSLLLSFVQADQPVTKYMIRYGVESGKYIYAADNVNRNSNQFLVQYLSPGVKYYFQIAAGNGCAATSWSSEFSASTTGRSESVNFPISQEIQKSLTGVQKSPSSNTDSNSIEGITDSHVQNSNLFQETKSFFNNTYSHIITFIISFFHKE